MISELENGSIAGRQRSRLVLGVVAIALLPAVICIVNAIGEFDLAAVATYTVYAVIVHNMFHVFCGNRREYLACLFLFGWFGWAFLFVYWHFSGVPSSVFTVVANTHMQEALSFLEAHDAWLPLAAWASLGIGGLLTVWKFSSAGKLGATGRIGYSFVLIFAVFSSSVWSSIVDDSSRERFYSPSSPEVSSKIYPLVFLSGINKIVSELAFPVAGERMNLVVHREQIEQPETHLLVITDASLSTAWQINGYARRTSPILSGFSPDELISFRRAYAGSNLTEVAVPLILSGTPAESFLETRSFPNILDLMKKAGFVTWWIGNQEFNMASAVGIPADFQSVATVHRVANYPYDGQLLRSLDDALETRYRKKYIVMHLMGNHLPYGARYPREFATFDHRKDGVCPVPEDRRNFRNCEYRDQYDNSVLYSDWVFGEIIKRVSAQAGWVTVIIVSDHGEAFGYEDSVFHGGLVASREEQHIPMFFWANASFRADNPQRWNTLMENVDEVVGNDAIFHTSADLYRVYSPAVDPGRSFAQPGYRLRAEARVLAGMTKLVPVKVR
jgi:glucan phosphoethanolaminetransferase (alkaline phosphatase superfamily)